MKNYSKISKKFILMFTGLLSTMFLAAQDAALDININTPDKGGAFYTQIWFWVVVGLVFILLLVALLRGGNKN